MSQFVVDRSTLLTGAALKAVEAAGYSPALYHSKTGLFCIIGQYLNANGVQKEKMADATFVSNLKCVLPPQANWLLSRPNTESAAATQIATVNDSTLHQIRREAKTAKLFAQQGIEVLFVGRYADATMKAKRALKGGTQ